MAALSAEMTSAATDSAFMGQSLRSDGTRVRLFDNPSVVLCEAVHSALPSEPVVDLPEDGYNSLMEKASVSKLKNNLSAYLRKVRAGHPVVIYDREVPIARLDRIESAGMGSDRLASLHAKGVTRIPLRQGSALTIVAGSGRPLPRAARLLEAVQQDRSEDR